MGRTQLNVRMNEDEKEEWREYSEQARWSDSLSDFVKTAVREKIERIDSPEGAGNDSPVGGEPSGELLDRLRSIETTIEDLDEDVSHAVDAVHGQEGIDPDLPPELYTALPDGEENAQTVAELVESASYAFTEAQARFALENMTRNMGDVHRTPEGMPGASPDAEIRWYRGR